MKIEELIAAAYPDIISELEKTEQEHEEVTEWLESNKLTEDIETATLILVNENKEVRLKAHIAKLQDQLKSFESSALSFLYSYNAAKRAYKEIDPLKRMVEAMNEVKFTVRGYADFKAIAAKRLKEHEAAIRGYELTAKNYPQYVEVMTPIKVKNGKTKSNG